MNHLDLIQDLAINNAKNIKIVDHEDNIEKDKPYFQIFKSDSNRWDCTAFNYKNHDNADRMDLYMNYFKNEIFPNILLDTEISGYYQFELHDGYNYLENNKNYDNTFVFSKNKFMDWKPCLMVDPYFVQNWGNMHTDIDDNKNWNDKINNIIFRGTTTGNKNPKKNQRLDICLWSLKNPILFDFKISKIAQIDKQTILDEIPNFNEIWSDPVPISEQINHKYILNLDGNVSKWNIETYNCNVINLKWISHEELFYYPLINDGFIHKIVDKNNIENMFHYHNNNPDESLEMIKRSKQFSKDYFRPFTHIYYTTCLFEEICK